MACAKQGQFYHSSGKRQTGTVLNSASDWLLGKWSVLIGPFKNEGGGSRNGDGDVMWVGLRVTWESNIVMWVGLCQ